MLIFELIKPHVFFKKQDIHFPFFTERCYSLPGMPFQEQMFWLSRHDEKEKSA